MDDVKIDREAMARLAKALAFICGAEHATTKSLKSAAASGLEHEIVKARKLFLKLKPGERQAAMAMLEEE